VKEEDEEDALESKRGKKREKGKKEASTEELGLTYETGQLENLINFKCEVCYQGVEFEDPDGWNEEELKEFRTVYDKENKKRKKGDPEPVPFED
jgi:hypothetical protein